MSGKSLDRRQKMKPMSKVQAAREFRKMRERKQKASPSELGLAIASLSIGVLVALSAVPAGILLGAKDCSTTMVGLLAFSAVTITLGLIGRKNAMGIAGTVLGLVALLETGCVFAYVSHQEQMERDKQVAKERERTKRAEEERRNTELEVEKRRIIAMEQAAKAKANEAKARVEEQRLIEQVRRHEEEQARREEDRRRKEELAEEERRAIMRAEHAKLQEEQRKRMEEKRRKERIEALTLLDRLLKEYPTALADFKSFATEYQRKLKSSMQLEKEIKSLEVRLNNLKSITKRLSYDNPQRKRYASEVKRIESILESKRQGHGSPLNYRVTISLSPDPNWRHTALNLGRSNEALVTLGQDLDHPSFAGQLVAQRLTHIHNAILGAVKELEPNGDEHVSEMLQEGRSVISKYMASNH